MCFVRKQVRKICQTIAFLSPATCMILSSLDLGLSPWQVVSILTGGLALSSFALSGSKLIKVFYMHDTYIAKYIASSKS